MAINKELYERYKAMKAAKMAASEQNSGTNGASSGGFKALSSNTSPSSSEQNYSTSGVLPQEQTSSQTVSQSSASAWSNSYSNINSNIELNQSQTVESYSSSNNYQADETTRSNYNSQFDSSGFNHPVQETAYQTVYQTQNTQPYTGNVPATYEQENRENSNLPKKFALIGFPLGHSLSEYIHQAGFKSLGINATYELIETKPENLVDTVKHLKSTGYSGFNVTIPLKLPVTMFLDEIDSSANTVNAINTVTVDSQTKFLKGYNTDAVGFRKAIPADVELIGKTAGILGTGGAARAAITALAQCKIKTVKLYTRNVANTLELLKYLRKTYPEIDFNSLQIDRIRDLSDIDILVNATPIGMKGISAGYSPVEEDALQTLKPNAIVYDVIYNPKKTMLIKLAQKHNYRTITGLDMLVYQAVEAQRIWTGRTPDFKDMKIAALENMD